MGQSFWVFPTWPFLLPVHLVFEEQSTGLTHWLLSWLPLGLSFSYPTSLLTRNHTRNIPSPPSQFTSVAGGAVGSFSGCLSYNSWGRTTPQQSCVISFYPHNTAVIHESALFYRGGKWGSGFKSLVEGHTAIRRVWDWSQGQSDLSVIPGHLMNSVGSIIGYISISKEFGNGL